MKRGYFGHARGDTRYPPASKTLDSEIWIGEHEQVSTALSRVMLTLIGYSVFCLLTLAAPSGRGFGGGIISGDA